MNPRCCCTETSITGTSCPTATGAGRRIDPKGVIGAACLDAGRFINNAMGFGETAAEKREMLLEAVTVFSDLLGENEERIFGGAFCDRIMGSSWGLKQNPDENEGSSRETLEVMVEVAGDVG